VTCATHMSALALQAVQRLQSAGFTAYWAGGCVRDLMLSRCPIDYDIATDATPDDILALFPRANLVGKAFGVVRVRLDDHVFEIATFREDSVYLDGRRPTSVSFTSAQEDARRRDFTINAMFHDPITGHNYDYVGGKEDLDLSRVRCVGDPLQRFREDYLRMLRAVRFAATLDFTIEDNTRAAILTCAPLIAGISGDRLRDELVRTLLEARRAGDALGLMQELSLLEHILPEVSALSQQPQPPQFHPEGDVLSHTMLMLNLMEDRSAHLALAALLHDVGKPSTAHEAPDRLRFDGHARRGAELAGAIMRRLRFSNRDIEVVTTCIANHMRFMDVQRMKPSTLRRMLGAPTFPLELELHRLDCLASHGSLDNYDFLVDAQHRLQGAPALPAPWISGHDIKRLGIPEGPAVGRWRHAAYEAQLAGRFPNREALQTWLTEALRQEAPPAEDGS